MILSARAKETVLLDVSKRKRIEACGVLLGNIDEAGNWQVEEALPLRNVFDSPTYFEFAPEDLLAIELEHPDRVIGVYHSHPTGYAHASGTDRENMRRVNVEEQIPWVWLIIRGPFDRSPTLLQQVQQRIGWLSPSQVIAYHHYTHDGLCEISVEYKEEDVAEDAGPEGQ